MSTLGFVLSTTKPVQSRRSRLCKRERRSWNNEKKRLLAGRVRMTAATDAAEVSADTSAAGLNRLLGSKDRRFIFVSGKGGVGKTTSSSSMAVKFAESGFKTLILSTDPAHSLGDCLDVDLTSGEIISVSDNLFALECKTEEAIEELRQTLAALKDVGGENSDASAAKDIAQKLGLSEFGDVLETLPPGTDELVALAKVLRLAEQSSEGFERVVIDTAPTGHTLRLLAFPDFLDNLLEKANALRGRLDNARIALNAISSAMGSKQFSEEAIKKASEQVENYRARMSELSDLFRDPSRTEFVVVAIPTRLSVAETKRLVSSLYEEGIWVRNLIVNQLISESVSEAYLEHIMEGQKRNLQRIENSFPQLTVTKIQRFDMEVRGVFGLRSFAQSAYPDSKLEETWPELFNESDTENRFIFVGGKGGVGKTSSSASMGVKLADRELKTLVISTDPAHSLADALDVKLTGEPTLIDNTGGNLYAMEVDTQAAVQEFKDLLTQYVQEGTGIGADVARRFGLEEFSGILENTPPGIDELVALTQVVNYVKSGNFRRVVVDTAPTGHTLRLLAFPEFLDGFLLRILRLKRRIDSLVSSLKNVFSGQQEDKNIGKAEQKIEEFRENMVELKKMFEDKERTQFSVVTIPTDLAVAESERLVKSLENDEIRVSNLIVNQIIPERASAGYIKRRFKEQSQCVENLEQLAGDVEFPLAIAPVPYFDEEVRGVEKLSKMAAVLFDGSSDEESS